MQEAEASMAEIGRKCNSDATEKVNRAVAHRAQETSTKSMIGFHNKWRSPKLIAVTRIWKSCHSSPGFPPTKLQVMYFKTAEAA